MMQSLLVGIVKAYRVFLSPSVYALQALQTHGAVAGSYLAASRIARCHPWCAGGVDHVPAVPPRLFTRLLSSSSSEKKPS
jgi:putative component of membrane protein insertase Oxa1/YidC/SpoIIIJ protein YidD